MVKFTPKQVRIKRYRALSEAELVLDSVLAQLDTIEFKVRYDEFLSGYLKKMIARLELERKSIVDQKVLVCPLDKDD